jgi:hypothetical protein
MSMLRSRINEHLQTILSVYFSLAEGKSTHCYLHGILGYVITGSLLKEYLSEQGYHK